jgi:hypothetical protein
VGAGKPFRDANAADDQRDDDQQPDRAAWTQGQRQDAGDDLTGGANEELPAEFFAAVGGHRPEDRGRE